MWDLERLWDQTVEGLQKAVQEYPDAQSVSVDTWGVDFVALDSDDHPVGPPRAYRDERTARTLEQFRQRIDDEEFFHLTGIAPATINTANQLVALTREEPELAEHIDTVLLLPDYFAWKLSGVKGWSRSICSSSGLCEPGSPRWSDTVFSRLGLPRSWVGDLNDDLTTVGPCTVEGIESRRRTRYGMCSPRPACRRRRQSVLPVLRIMVRARRHAGPPAAH